MNENTIEKRLEQLSMNIQQTMDILNSHIVKEDFIEDKKIQQITNFIISINIDQALSAAGNTIRTMEILIKLLHYENKRRIMSNLLQCETESNEIKIQRRNKTKYERRKRLNPYERISSPKVFEQTISGQPSMEYEQGSNDIN